MSLPPNTPTTRQIARTSDPHQALSLAALLLERLLATLKHPETSKPQRDRLHTLRGLVAAHRGLFDSPDDVLEAVALRDRLALPRPGDAPPGNDLVLAAAAHARNAIDQLLPHVADDVLAAATRDPRKRNLILTAATLFVIVASLAGYGMLRPQTHAGFVAADTDSLAAGQPNLVGDETLRPQTQAEFVATDTERLLAARANFLASLKAFETEYDTTIASSDPLFAAYQDLEGRVDRTPIVHIDLRAEIQKPSLIDPVIQLALYKNGIKNLQLQLDELIDSTRAYAETLSIKDHLALSQSIAERLDRQRRQDERAASGREPKAEAERAPEKVEVRDDQVRSNHAVHKRLLAALDGRWPAAVSPDAGDKEEAG